MYEVYLGDMLCPVAPDKLQLEISNKNKTLTLINDGEVNILKKAGLTEIRFDLLLPNVKYPFAVYTDGFKPANYFLDYLERLKNSQKPFKFKVIRKFPSGKMLFDTNMTVSLEEYSPSDDVKEGFDTKVSVELKQYRDYGTKTCEVTFIAPSESSESSESTEPSEPEAKITPPEPPRQTDNSPAPTEAENKTYTVQKNDTLWGIAKKFYGNGAEWQKIYNANTDVCGKPYTKGGVTYSIIHEGQVLTIPM